MHKRARHILNPWDQMPAATTSSGMDNVAKSQRRVAYRDALLITGAPRMGVDSGLPDLPRGDRASGAPIRLSPGWACLLNRWPIPGGSRSRPNCLGILWTPAQPVPASRAPRGLWRLLRRLPPPPTRRLCVHLQMSTVTSKKPVSTRPHRGVSWLDPPFPVHKQMRRRDLACG